MFGPSRVGKTAIYKQLDKKRFYEEIPETIGADFKFFYVQRANGDQKFQFWDLAGNYRFNPVNKFVFRGAHAVIYVFDVTNRVSLTETIDQIKQI